MLVACHLPRFAHPQFMLLTLIFLKMQNENKKPGQGSKNGKRLHVPEPRTCTLPEMQSFAEFVQHCGLPELEVINLMHSLQQLNPTVNMVHALVDLMDAGLDDLPRDLTNLILFIRLGDQDRLELILSSQYHSFVALSRVVRQLSKVQYHPNRKRLMLKEHGLDENLF